VNLHPLSFAVRQKLLNRRLAKFPLRVRHDMEAAPALRFPGTWP
jgi:hypothetical protein